MMTEFHLAALVSRSCYCACWLTNTVEYNQPIVVILLTFPAMISQNVYSENGQWSNNIYQALATQTILISGINSLFEYNIHIEYHWPYSFYYIL